MDGQIIDEVTEWESRDFSGGYAGLHDLADDEFTGAVSDGMAWLFALNGRVVGVFDGSIESFENADGTAYEAPHPSLPLLFAMQETGGETRAKYYTEETPLSQVDETLSAGGFTGYVELSENVLSGDYYVVYQGGRSLSCAFVGNSRQVLTGEEAFDRADDEVGIYQVIDVDLDIVDIPDPEGESEDIPATGATGTAAAGATDATDADEGTSPETTDGLETSARAETRDVESTGSAGVEESEDTDAERPEATGAEKRPDASAADAADATTAGSDDADDEGDPEAGADGSDAEADTAEADADPAGVGAGTEDGDGTATSETRDRAEQPAAVEREAIEAAGAEAGATGSEAGTATEADAETATEAETGTPDGTATGSADDSVFSEEERWREARTIPSLDPEKSQTDPAAETEHGGSSGSQRAGPEATRSRRSDEQPSEQPTPQRTGRGGQGSETGSATDAGDVAALRERLEEVEQARSEAETARERLAAEREDLAEERDELREENEQLRSRIEELEDEVDRLERQLSEARERSGGSAERTMSPQQALEGTNLFVRYESKGGATLEEVHADAADREEAAENLRVEHHTSFETEGLHVDGRPFEEFLRGTIEYSFVEWIVQDLLYEIRDTGNTTELAELFDAIPEIDRAELYGSASLRYTENGEEHREQQSFDVVLRDRMGTPLLVANLNDSRDPASEDEMTSLVRAARRVEETDDELGAAFYVTSSYFEPAALEAADDATGGGLLSRGKRKSFVKLSRKQGFHLCLIETREGNFHVNVPEL